MNLKNKYKAIIGVLLFSLLLWNCGEKEISGFYVKSVANPIININGTWNINTKPEKEFWKQNEIDIINWKEIQVPGEAMMQGFYIKNDESFAYKKEISIPLDYKDNNIYLQFDGVYSYARVWVNGNFVRAHHGGFTRWKCNITPYVKPGEKAQITVEVTDRSDDISYASGYAKHQIGGILRDVNLLALPKNHPKNIQLKTDLDAEYKNANLIVSGNLKKVAQNSKIQIELFDASEKKIILKENKVILDKEDSFQIRNIITNPKKWDAEHPNLYTLRISYYENNELLWSKDKSFGFREVKVDGNKLLVNGNPVKLRGACRHDVHPTLGRVATPEYELKDVLLAKEANINFIRTSHYPPSDNFLKLCDEYGIYVEDETAICFVLENRIKGYEGAIHSNSDPEFTDRYLSQLKEMVDAHRNHPSVIIWSIGNESLYGSNFQKSYDWVKKNDNTRPIIFSWPGTVPDSLAKPYQILSMHYPPYKGEFTQFGKTTEDLGYKKMPTLFDEWAHVACYNSETIIEDLNIRDFWGQSLDKLWAGVFEADGGLGGGIWGMIDETFSLPKELEGFRDTWGIDEPSVASYKGTTVGYGDWGIVDVWRRKKPEFWNTKKAYSPIRILTTTVSNYKKGSEIHIPIYNRFDHTNLNEITIKYKYNGITNILTSKDLKPHAKGDFSLPILDWDANKQIALYFYDKQDKLIDSYNIKQAKKPVVLNSITDSISKKIIVENKGKTLIVHTNKGQLFFNKSKGLLNGIKTDGKKTSISGPFMTYKTLDDKQIAWELFGVNDYGKDWKLEKFKYQLKENIAVVTIEGNYGNIKASFELQISTNGKIKTSYTYKNLPKEHVREVGLKYNFDAVFDSLFWEKESYWSSYPENHIGASSGTVALYPKVLNTYRQAPQKQWNRDTKSFYYEGTDNEQDHALTHIAKATKENCIEYSLFKGDEKWVMIKGNGKVSCRLAKKDNTIVLYLSNAIDYPNLNWGNYEHTILLEGSYSGEVELFLSPNERTK